MADDLADLERLRGELLKMNALLHDPRASAGTRKRASKALGRLAVQAIDVALDRLRRANINVTDTHEQELV